MTTSGIAAADTIYVQSTQSRYPQYANNATTSVPSYWDTPAAVKASDDTRSAGTLVSFSGIGAIDLFKVEDFGFSIPTGATIDGIEIIVERQASAAGVTDRMTLRKPLGGMTFQEVTKVGTANWPINSDAEGTLGGGHDLWTMAWTPNDINSTEFGAYVTARSASGGQSVAIDGIRIVVHYTEAVTIDWNTVPAAGEIAMALLFGCVALLGIWRLGMVRLR